PGLLISLLLSVSMLMSCKSAATQDLALVRPLSDSAKQAPRNSVAVIHVFVALCDNVNQGIVPVSASLGNGDDPPRNLYWGAAFGVKTFFTKSRDWRPVPVQTQSSKSSSVVLERSIFKRRDGDV